jgi:hypothetical protein
MMDAALEQLPCLPMAIFQRSDRQITLHAVPNAAPQGIKRLLDGHRAPKVLHH